MDLVINGKSFEREFDIAETIRVRRKPLDMIYHRILPGAHGTIDIDLISIKNKALIQAIEIAEEDRDLIHINCGSDRDFIDWAGATNDKASSRFDIVIADNSG